MFLTLGMQVLFIAPIHGKRKPLTAYTNAVKEGSNPFWILDSLEENSEKPTAAELRKMRLENIVKRSNKKGSKVCFV